MTAAAESVGGSRLSARTYDLGRAIGRARGMAETTEFTDAVLGRVATKLEIWDSLRS